LGPTQPSIQ